MKKYNQIIHLYKYISFLILIACLSCQSEKPNIISDVSKLEFLGNVKSYVEYSYLNDTRYNQVRIDNIDQFLRHRNHLFESLKHFGIKDFVYYRFNRDGQTLENLIFHSEIDQNTSLKFKYDKFGNKINESVSEFGGEIFSRKTFEYNNENRIIEQKEFYRDTSFEFMSTYHYNSSMKLDNEKRYDKNRELFLEYFYKYNPDGKIIEVKYNSDKIIFSYNDKSKLVEKITYNRRQEITEHLKLEYDSIGNVVKKYTLDTWLEKNHTSIFKYDSDQKLNESLFYNKDSRLLSKTNSLYNPKGKLIKQEVFKYGELPDQSRTTIKTYNEMENIVQTLRVFARDGRRDTTLMSFQYSYDSHGNILKIENSTKMDTEFREFEYY